MVEVNFATYGAFGAVALFGRPESGRKLKAPENSSEKHQQLKIAFEIVPDHSKRLKTLQDVFRKIAKSIGIVKHSFRKN